MDGLLKSNDLPAAIKLFASVPLTSRDTVMHSSLIHKFTLLNDDTSVKSTYQSYRTDTPQNSPDLILFNILLTYFLRTKQSHDSLHTLHELDKHDLSPDSYTATAVIYGLVQNGETASAEPTSLRLLRNKIPLSIHAVTALITGLSHNRDAIGMMRWIRAILLPYPPFQIPHSSLEELAALSRVPVEDVPTLLNQHAEVLGQLSGIVPDYKFYSTCVIGFLRTCALECADGMVRYMVEHRVDGVQDGRVLVLMDRVCAAWNRCGKEDRGESLRELCTKESK
ncbi:hypothetical protein HDU99_002380 [Rhizoclosmatium hyalinum]|nr:hypothetical protein HDU99_002380 [Rhizoclosmatium hyalinum]